MNLASRDLTSDQRHRRQHVALRALGLVFTGMSFAATSWLERLVHRLPVHDPTARELGVALIAVFAFCFGAALAIHGRALFEPNRTPRVPGPHPPSSKGTSDD